MHAKNLLAYFPCKTHFCRHFIHLGLGGSQFGETNGFEQNNPGQKGKNHLYCGILYISSVGHVMWVDVRVAQKEMNFLKLLLVKKAGTDEWQNGKRASAPNIAVANTKQFL